MLPMLKNVRTAARMQLCVTSGRTSLEGRKRKISSIRKLDYSFAVVINKGFSLQEGRADK